MDEHSQLNLRPVQITGVTRPVHDERPDYNRPLLEVPEEAQKRLLNRLSELYGEESAARWLPELIRVMQVYYAHKPPELIKLDREFDPAERFSEKDMVLITYGDLFRGEGRSPLASLAELLERRGFRQRFNTIHILPFFPYSSDRGFSVIDFTAVDPNLGSWLDVAEIGRYYQLLFDGVLNHASSQSDEFLEFLNGDPRYQDYFIWFRSPDELSREQRALIRRPRTSDILTEFQSINGPVWVWTTFSPDQIDLNYRSPELLIAVLDTLLLYVRRGADILRLDAITYLWAELGTTCASLEETHVIIKLFRDVLNVVAPRVELLTETNVPHAENISYFGNGYDEAQLVYNFALPPLVLHTFYRANSTELTGWAQELEFPSEQTTYLNMLDTHDGVGVMGIRDILSADEIDAMIRTAQEHGAFVSYRTGEDGTDQPYEINTTWFGALNRSDTGEDLAFQVKRFVASRSIPLVLKGVPAIYFHGLIGTGNDPEIVHQTNSKRDINRRFVDEADLLREARDPDSKLSHIRRQFAGMLRLRVEEAAFHPSGTMEVLDAGPAVFAVLRASPEKSHHILAVVNVTAEEQHLELTLEGLASEKTCWIDLISGNRCHTQDR